MSSEAVGHRLIWNNLPLLFKGLMLLMIPVPALLVGALVLSCAWREQRQALASVDRLVAARQTLQDVSYILLVPGNAAQDSRALRNLTNELGPAPLNIDHTRGIDSAVRRKLESLAALGATNVPGRALLDRDREATESLQASIRALALEYDQLLTDQLSLAGQAGKKLVTQSARSAFVFLFGELLAALVFLYSINEQVHHLKMNTRRLAAGQPLQPLLSDNWEINQITQDLVTASVALGRHERDQEASCTNTTRPASAELLQLAGSVAEPAPGGRALVPSADVVDLERLVQEEPLH